MSAMSRRWTTMTSKTTTTTTSCCWSSRLVCPPKLTVESTRSSLDSNSVPCCWNAQRVGGASARRRQRRRAVVPIGPLVRSSRRHQDTNRAAVGSRYTARTHARRHTRAHTRRHTHTHTVSVSVFPPPSPLLHTLSLPCLNLVFTPSHCTL